MFIVNWVNYFVYNWNKEETLFALKFGMIDYQRSLDASEEETKGDYLPTFKGVRVRSIKDDNLNSPHQNPINSAMRLILAYIVFLIVLLVYSGCIIGVFLLSYDLNESHTFPENLQIMNLPVTLPALLNIVLIMIFD